MGDEQQKPAEVNDTDLVPVDQALAVVEQRNKVMERVRTVAIQASKGHWLDHDGKPRLDSYGAEIVARIFGIRVVDKEWERIDHPDDGNGAFYEYIVQGTFCLPGNIDRLENVIGSASSRDKFLGTETSAGREIWDVQPGVILKKAESNMIQRGVTMLCGLRGMTWEQLTTYGIKQEDAARVEYVKGAQGGGRGAEFTFKFGSAKGKTIAEANDKDLVFYLGAYERDLGDPDKKKYHANSQKAVELIKAEQARRANVKAGTTPTAPTAGASPYQRILTMAHDLGIPDPEIGGLIREATGKGSSAALVEEDVAKCKAAFERAKSDQDDIRF